MAAPNNMHNLTTLIKRLEAATSRLEDIATSVDPSTPNGVTPTAGGAAPGVLAGVAAAGAVAGTVAASNHSEHPPALEPIPEAAPPEPVPRFVEEFDTLIEEDVTAFVTASTKIGGLVEEQAKAVLQAFQAERTYLLVTSKAKKPDHVPPELMTDLHRSTSTVDEIREGNRPSPLFTHLSAVSEGIVALGWIVEKRPVDFITDTLGGAQYYGNKVLKEYKEKDKTHVEYMQAYYKIFRSLSVYAKQNFATGLTWNNKDGIDAVEALKQLQSGSATPKASAAGGPPPPPPPPLPNFNEDSGAPPPPPPPAGGAPKAKGGDMNAVFDQLNQGSAVTSGLRKVDKSEMTHKNPSLRAGAVVPERSNSQTSVGSSGRGKSPLPGNKPESLKSKKQSKLELDGSKWIVENFENTGDRVVKIEAERNQSILISKCSKCVIRVVGKANAVSVDNCSGLSILLESLVSSIDIIKCPKFGLQIDGTVPTIMLDQIDGGQIYLGDESMKSPPEIFTNKCSAINIILPPPSDYEDNKEHPLPEQMRTFYKNGTFVTEIVEHAG